MIAACRSTQDRGHTRKIEDDAWKKASFDKTQEKPGSEQTAVGADSRLKSRDKTPHDAYGWKEDSRTNSMQDEIRGQFG